MGHSHIPQKYATPINGFDLQTFDSWLNLHCPCLFATEVISDKGKIVKRYKHEDVKTPLACLATLHDTGLVTFREGETCATQSHGLKLPSGAYLDWIML